MLRPVLTEYYADLRGNQCIRRIRSVHIEEAVARCLLHMRKNDYGARTACVFKDETARPFATITYNLAKGDANIIYQEPYKESK